MTLGTQQLGLTDFVSVATLQSLQDGFAEVTGIATSIRDPQGTAITTPSEPSAFCLLVNSTPSGAAACREGHAAASRSICGAAEACRYQCHAGLTQFVAPIVVEGKQLGAIIMGDRPLGGLDRGALLALSEKHTLPADLLLTTAGAMKPWSEAEMAAAARFVQQLANTIAQLCYQAYQLRRRVEELAALQEVSSTLAGRMNLQEILDTATQKLVETMRLRAAGLRLLDEDTGELRIASVAHMPMSYLDTEPILLAESPIEREALETGQTLYVEDVRSDPRTSQPDRACKEGLASALITPLVSAGKRIGVLRAYTSRVHRFSAYDISLLEAIASQVATAIVNARLRRDALEAEKLERQVKLAAEVQRRMIPSKPPEHARYRFGCIYEPSSELGGDFYDFIDLPNGDVALIIADVVGKGVPASLMMASARSVLRSHAKRVADIGELMRVVNRRLCYDTLTGEFVTACYIVLHQDGRGLTYCNAGHEPPLLLRGTETHRLDAGGLVWGVTPEAEYETGSLALQPGDWLVLTTDGLIESLNYRDEEYGRDRMRASLRLHSTMAPDLPVALLAKQLLWDVRRFVGYAPQADDITLVVVKVI